MMNSKSADENLLVNRSIFDPKQFLGSVLLGIVSGGAGGVVAGILGRISMRAVAIQAGQTPNFSIDGTLFVIGIGAVIGALVGLVFGIILPFLPGSINQKGLTFGSILSFLLILIIVLMPQEGELALVSKVALTALFASLPLIYGFVMGTVATRLVSDEAKVVGESGRFAQTAAFITIVAALTYATIEITLLITFPAISNLGYDLFTFLDNAAGGTLLLMVITGTAGLLRSGVTGKSVIAKIGLCLTLLTASLMGLSAIGGDLNTVEMHGLVRMMSRLESDANLTVLLVFFLAGLAGLLFAGIAALRTKRWQGWHQYSPLLVGLFPFVSLLFLHPALFSAIVEISIPGRNRLAYVIGALFALCWVLLGIALRAETNLLQSFSNQDTTDQTVQAV